MNLETKINNVLHEYYYTHHDKIQMQNDLVSLVRNEHELFIHKIVRHINTRLALHSSRNKTIHDVKCDAEGAEKELQGMANYFNKQLQKEHDSLIVNGNGAPPPDEL